MSENRNFPIVHSFVTGQSMAQTHKKMDNWASIEDSHLRLFVHVSGPMKVSCSHLTDISLSRMQVLVRVYAYRRCVFWMCVHLSACVSKRMWCTDNAEPQAAEYLKWPWTSAFSIPMAAGTVSTSVCVCVCACVFEKKKNNEALQCVCAHNSSSQNL